MNSGFIKTFLLSVTVVLTCAIVFGGFLLLKGHPSVPRGLSLKAVTEVLRKEGLVRQPLLFQSLLRVTQGNKRVRAGEFRFRQGASLLNQLKVLYYSDPITHPLTIPEGWNVRQIATLLGEKNLGNTQRFIQLALSSDSSKRYKLNTPHLEGFLFPDTYLISRIDGEEKILDQMVNRFFKEINTRFKDQISRGGMSLEQVVTLASIVEKETGRPEERPRIASVFFNRLKKGMRLQSDPTTIYGIENFNGNLTKADLQRYSPYNTYAIPALPLGPIASPGGDAIAAVLKPEESDYLYFVSDNNGSHFFTRTYQDHLKFVKEYQQSRSRRARGSNGG